MFTGRTDAEAETLIFWPPDVKSWLIGKDSDAGRDWEEEEKGTTEDEMVGWHHCHNGHGFGWTPGVGDGQGGLVCCDSWGCKGSDMTERLNWTESDISTYQHNAGESSFRPKISLFLPHSDVHCVDMHYTRLFCDLGDSIWQNEWMIVWNLLASPSSLLFPKDMFG